MEPRPGPLETAKRTDNADGDVQPEAAEVESARLLANQAAPELEAEGLTEEQIRRLADEFVARDRSETVDAFVPWARERCRDHAGEPPSP